MSRSIRALLQSMPSSTRKHSIAAVGAALAKSRSSLRDEIAGKANATRDQLGGRESQSSQDADIRQTATAYGGLFYLLSTVLELGIGESLWKACLPEGQILAGAAATLLGPAASGDPAPALFGGVATREVFETAGHPIRATRGSKQRSTRSAGWRFFAEKASNAIRLSRAG